MGRARRTDANHAEIRDALRARGFRVIDASHAGRGVPDLFVIRGGEVLPLEVKDGAKAPAHRQLTKDEEEWTGAAKVVRCAEEALCVVGAAPHEPHCFCGEVPDPPWFVEARRKGSVRGVDSQRKRLNDKG